MSDSYDLIVIGGGGFGTSTAYYAALSGMRVLVIDQYGRGHDRGSSHGETRVIRKAYFEHPDYVPLLKEAYKLWGQLGDKTGSDLLTICGLMLAGPRDCDAIRGTITASQEYVIELEEVPEDDFPDRFPGFEIPENFDVVYEPDGGFLKVDECVEAYVTLAEAKGVQFAWNEAVTHWESNGRSATVFVGEKKYLANRLVMTAGAWAAKLLAETTRDSALKFPQLNVLRKLMMWFPVKSPVYDIAFGASPFFFSMPYGDFYGLPSVDGETIKICEHSGGVAVVDPAQIDQELHEDDLRPLEKLIHDVLPDVVPECESYSTCIYTMSPDGHFVLDQHPEFSNVYFAAGFSGHGYKFAPVIGKALAELACDNFTKLPIGFLSLDRFRTMR